MDGNNSLLQNKGIIIKDGTAIVKEFPTILDKTIQLDVLAVTVVKQGTSEFSINGKDYKVRVGDMLLNVPSSIFKVKRKSEDLLAYCFCISLDMIREIVSFTALTWDVVKFMINTPVVSLNENEIRQFDLYYKLMAIETLDSKRPCFKESLQSLLRAFLYNFTGVLNRFVTCGMYDYSQGHNLFKNFLTLIGNTYPRKRYISFYSEKLNVTPKYLSSVCKESCGKTASWLIHEAVTKDIRNLLIYSNKSIKEIMVELGFPSLSFFGKYVKKHFGMGPKEFRAQRLP